MDADKVNRLAGEVRDMHAMLDQLERDHAEIRQRIAALNAQLDAEVNEETQAPEDRYSGMAPPGVGGRPWTGGSDV